MGWLNYNGKIYNDDAHLIGADNRGLRYGDGLFETMKMKNGQLILEDEHFARLWKGMKILQFAIPRHFNPDKLQEEIAQLTTKNQHEAAARIRITVFRGNGGLYDVTDHLPHYIIQTWPLSESNSELNSNGLDIGIYSEVKKSCDLLCNLKTNNYLPYVMAAFKAKSKKWNDAVLINQYGRICDSTIANVFIVKDEVIYTPALSEGCVAGVLRNYLLNNLSQTGFTCCEKELTIDELMNADEVFLTNSIYNIRWVKSVDSKTFGNTIIQKIYYALVPTIL